MKHGIAFILLSCMLSSCASMLLSKKVNTVILSPNSQAKIYVNDSLRGTGASCQVREKLDRNGRQIRIEVEGYKPAYMAMLQTKTRGAFWMDFLTPMAIGGIIGYVSVDSENLRAATSGALLGSIVSLYTGFISEYLPHHKRFPEKLDLTKIKLYKKLERKPTDKFVVVSNVSVDIAKENFKHRGDKGKTTSAKENLKIDNTIFSEALNWTLFDAGYIDSTGSVLTNNGKELFLSAKLIGIDWHSMGKLHGTAAEAAIDMEWTVLDAYGQSLYSQIIHSESGQFIQTPDHNEMPRKLLADAVAHSLLLLFDKPEMQKYLQQEDPNKHLAAMQQLSIAKPSQTPKTIDEAMSACATVLVKAESGEGHGSGLFITRDGYLLTNYHVVAGAKSIEVQTHDGKKYAAQVIRSNQVYDLALIKIEATSEFAFELPSGKNYKIGADVFAIGTPSSKDLNQTLSKGIISGARKDDTGADVIQTDVSVNRGNSGGALIDKNAVLVGVVNAKLIGLGVEGVGFAIPAKDVLAALKLQY